MRHPSRWLARLGLIAGGFLAGVSSRAAVLPDHPAAVRFGVSLQREYGEKKSGALVARLDSEAMLFRVFGARAREWPDYEQLRKQWDTLWFSSITRQFQALEEFPLLAVDRVALIEGERVLEGVFFRRDGHFQVANLVLRQSPGGEVRIVDFQTAGSVLAMTRAMRHSLLLMRVGIPGLLDPEEITLAGYGRTHGLTITHALTALGQGDQGRAAGLWSGLPAHVQATRFGREIRNRIALLGHAPFMEQLRTAIAAGEDVPAFLRFALATSSPGEAASLAALDGVLAAHQQLPWLRIVKADLLLRAKRPAEAEALAQDVCRLGPASPAAYSVLVRCALMAEREEAAREALREWNRFAPVPVIAEHLSSLSEPAVTTFLATPWFQSWKDGLVKHPPQPR